MVKRRCIYHKVVHWSGYTYAQFHGSYLQVLNFIVFIHSHTSSHSDSNSSLLENTSCCCARRYSCMYVYVCAHACTYAHVWMRDKDLWWPFCHSGHNSCMTNLWKCTGGLQSLKERERQRERERPNITLTLTLAQKQSAVRKEGNTEWRDCFLVSSKGRGVCLIHSYTGPLCSPSQEMWP